jgi:uncharacterized protein YjbI with pentapeptide repeats
MPSWPACSECRGERLEAEHCLAHLTEEELDRVGQRLRAGAPLCARGVRITSERLTDLLSRLKDDGVRPQVPEAQFDEAHFVGGDARFVAARFLGDAHFHRARFAGDAHFDWAQFMGEADFRKAQFSGEADFRGATFARGRFKETQFGGDVRFPGARFSRDADFQRARFTTAHYLGPLKTDQTLILMEATFLEHVTVTARAGALQAVDTRFHSGADVLVQSASVSFDRAAFGATSTVSPAGRRDIPVGRDRNETIPSVVSLQGARMVDLTLSGIDLRTCRFRGAEGLASLRLEQVLLAEAPQGWTRARRWPLPVRWTRRVAIAEEHWWRAAHGFRWPAPRRADAGTADAGSPAPHQIAAIYRALRRGREDIGDEPGAADFYYGEMEMRRHSRYSADKPLSSEPPYEAPSVDAWAGYDNTRHTPAAERLVLWLYWLVSGYGLRASRALAALGITIAIGAVLLHLFGFDARETPEAGALLYAVESSISLLRAPATNILTDAGNVIQVVLRLAGPLFFGLALISLRGRVKR